jgi:hypothetical protein
MSLNESMIAELLSVMKFRIKFMKLLAGLKQTQQQEPSVSEVPSTSIAATIPSTPLVATVQTSSVVATSASIGENDESGGENAESQDNAVERATRYFFKEQMSFALK